MSLGSAIKTVTAELFAPRSLVMLLALVFCTCSGSNMGGPVPVGDGGGDDDDGGDGTGCVDRDGDGFGTRCDNGPDCDDRDADIHSGCDDGPEGSGPGVWPEGTVPGEGGGGPGEGGRSSWSPDDDNSSNVHVDEDGDLTLDSNFDLNPAVWIANDEEGTVSRLDAETGREIGRYPAVIGGRDVDADPSRTAIDFRGDCWVANRWRDTGRPGSVTKIASHIEDCVDRNGDGEIMTSQDLDGDGVITLTSSEYLNGADECVLFTVEVGGPRSIARALAIAPDASGTSPGGNAWVGLNYGESDHGERAFVELDGDTGAVVRQAELPLNPYGALASKFNGVVWFTNARWQESLPDNPPAIVSVDFRTGEVSPRYEVEADDGGCVGTYGITVDADGRVWVAGHSCDRAFRFDPTTEDWMTVELGDNGNSRGIVADADGWIWVAHSNGCGRDRCGVITRFRGDDGSDREHFYLPRGDGTIGVDLDASGRVWVVNKASDSASRLDPITGVIDEFPTGDGPYTYSDFTGHSLLMQFPRGYYRAVMEACAGAHWLTMLMDADIPLETSVEVRVRTAESAIDLNTSDWVGPWITSPGDLQILPGPVPDGRFLEMEVSLSTSSEHGAVPSVRSIDFIYNCPVM